MSTPDQVLDVDRYDGSARGQEGVGRREVTGQRMRRVRWGPPQVIRHSLCAFQRVDEDAARGKVGRGQARGQAPVEHPVGDQHIRRTLCAQTRASRSVVRRADKFVEGTLMVKMPVEGGFDGRPEERTAEVVNLQTS
jgi:hypothetical protein